MQLCRQARQAITRSGRVGESLRRGPQAELLRLLSPCCADKSLRVVVGAKDFSANAVTSMTERIS